MGNDAEQTTDKLPDEQPSGRSRRKEPEKRELANAFSVFHWERGTVIMFHRVCQ